MVPLVGSLSRLSDPPVIFTAFTFLISIPLFFDDIMI